MQAFGDVAQPSSLGRAARPRVPLLEPRGLCCYRRRFCEVLPSAQQAAGWDRAVPPYFPHPARGSCHGLVSSGGSSCCGFSVGDCPIPYGLLFKGCCKFEAYNFCRASEALALGSFSNTFPAHCCQDAALSERQRPAAIPSRREAPRAEKLLLHQVLLLFRCKPVCRHGQGLGSLPRFAVLKSRCKLCKSSFLGELQNQPGLNFRWIQILGCSKRARASASCQSAWGQLQAFQNREIDFAGLVLWFAVVGFVFSLSLR